MSYCRFSSENFMCDVYVYEDVYGGWTTHVAGNRYALSPLPSFPIPWPRGWAGTWEPGTRTIIYPSKWKRRAAKVYFWIYAKWESVRGVTLDRLPRRRIELPFAGQRFNDATPQECAARLKELKAIGYNVPDYAINALMNEKPDSPHET